MFYLFFKVFYKESRYFSWKARKKRINKNNLNLKSPQTHSMTRKRDIKAYISFSLGPGGHMFSLLSPKQSMIKQRHSWKLFLQSMHWIKPIAMGLIQCIIGYLMANRDSRPTFQNVYFDKVICSPILKLYKS